MAHVAPIYPNFARGEVSPLMFGRIDIEQYPTCLDKCRNVYIRPYGCATRLSGTEFIANAKNNGKARLLKFVFSATDSYIIECGAGYFRFYQDGAPVVKDTANAWLPATSYKVGDFVSRNSLIYYCIEDHTSGTFATDLENGKWVQQNIYEVPNEYYEDQLDSIQYVQLDDIIKLTCLPHNGDNSTAKPKELIRRASNDWVFRDVEFKETPYLDQNTSSITLNPSATTGNINIVASSAYFNSGMIGTNFWIGTKVTDTTTNKDVQGYVKITGVSDSTHATATVESTLSGASATKLWGEGAFADYRGYPSCIALYDGRLWYGRTPTQPRNLYGSKPYAYETFTPAVDNEDDAGINIQLATNANGDGSDIKWIIGASYLLCGTYGGEFVIRGTGDGAITATDISARQRTNWGGEPVQPIVAGTFVHFLQRNGNKLRQFQYDFYYDSYKAVDVSIFSEHLLSSPIKEMALQKNPDSIIYLMREDGKVVMLTLEQDQSVQAWSLLEELGAEVESIQTIPSYNGNYDEVYMLMNRKALETELSYQCSNPALTITDNYTGTKETAGQEVITLTYNGSNGVWTTPESTELETSLNVVSSNPSLTVTNSYNQTKPQTGTITEVLECIGWTGKYKINGELLEQFGTPTFNPTTGAASGFGYGGYKIKTVTDTDNFEIKFKTEGAYFGFNSNLIYNSTSKYIGLYEYSYRSDSFALLIVNSHVIKFDSELYPSTTYIVKRVYNTDNSSETWYLYNESGTEIEYHTFYDVTAFPLTGTCIGRREYSAVNYNRGTIYLKESKINGVSLTEQVLGWQSQTTGETVDISSSNYEITLSGAPQIGNTLTCVWTTISGYLNPDEYDLTITGTPQNGDTITLTYDTDFTATQRFIERMCDPITPDDPNNWWYVRSGLKYDGFKLTEGNNLTLSGNQGTVTATAGSNIFSENKVGNRIRFIDENYNILGEGTITTYTDETQVTLDITTYFQSSTITGGSWGISTDVVSNLDHLDGREVQVYADTVEQESKTVTDGSIDIEDAFIVVAGLPYTSYITTMPMEAGSQNGTAVGKRKRISEMAIRVWNTIGVKVGRDLDNLYDTIYKQKEPFTGVIPNIKYNQGWVWDANITVEQSHPYPMNILSIAPIVTEVDK